LEHTDPNPFKEFHIGHAYSNTVGVAIGKLLAASGSNVHQVSYHGDVGLHIAMAIFGLMNPYNKKDLGLSYAYGARTYEHDPQAKAQIDMINKQVYEKNNPEINALYEEGRKRSLEEFEKTYHKLGAKFEKNYFESETAVEGMQVVRQNLGKVFEESAGAVIYDGEKAGLHKRVFITRQNLPTYEAKEIGLAFAKQRDYPQADKFIVITANEIDEYFKVLVAAIKEIDHSLGEKIVHLSHGVVKFPGGKMSSRTGNVKLFTDLEADIAQALKDLYETEPDPEITLGAIKYEFLKHRIGSDFIFDVGESISLEGNSGPYLQYAHARACSILSKAQSEATGDSLQVTGEKNSIPQPLTSNLDDSERSLARKISEYPEVFTKSVSELMPHHICTYLYELAQNFNSFYEKSRIIGDEREAPRLRLVQAYQQVLKSGLNLLNIAAPEKM